MQQGSTVQLAVWITVLTCISVAALANQNVSHSTRGEVAFGDRDLDGDVDLFDAAGFQICFSGPGPVALAPECSVYDREPDGDVDLDDYALFRDAAGFSLSYHIPTPGCSFNGFSCGGQAKIPFTVYKSAPDAPVNIQLIYDLNADGISDGILPVFGDADSDGDIDLRDAAQFQRCFGQGGSNCDVFDFADDGDVDIADYREFSEVFGLGSTAFVTSGEFPIGQHALRVFVNDTNGYGLSETIPFAVADCKAPTPICINGISQQLSPLPPGTDADGDGDIDTGALTLFATDFIASPVSDCSEPIDYSISRPFETPDVEQQVLIVTCDDGAFVSVRVYAWDQAVNPETGMRNHDYCESNIIIDNNFSLCTP